MTLVKDSAADNEHFLVVLFELLDQSDEVAIAADNHECIDMISGERHLERIEREVDVGAVFVAAGREVALNHLDRVLRHAAAVFTGSFPVAVGDLGDDFAPFLDGFENGSNIEVPVQGALDADLDVIEVDKYRDL